MRDITRPITIFALDRSGPGTGWCAVPALLAFSRDDPLAVECVFSLGNPDEQTAVFAFDLLVHISTSRPAGSGLVRFEYDQLDPQFTIVRFVNVKGQKFTYRIQGNDIKVFVYGVRGALDVDAGPDRVAESLQKALADILEGSK